MEAAIFNVSFYFYAILILVGCAQTVSVGDLIEVADLLFFLFSCVRHAADPGLTSNLKGFLLDGLAPRARCIHVTWKFSGWPGACDFRKENIPEATTLQRLAHNASKRFAKTEPNKQKTVADVACKLDF